MTVQIKRSQVGPNFEIEVAAFVHDLRGWREHMSRVERDKKNQDLPDIERHMAHPRPVYPAIVEAAVNENGDADYVLIDDLPTADHILAGKKRALMHAVSISEAEAFNQVCPAGKRRLFSIREDEILAADSKIAAGVQMSWLKRAVGAQPDIEAEIKAKRSPEDAAHLEDQKRRREQTRTIERIAAQAMHDIEDLTTETVDGWTAPVFPT